MRFLPKLFATWYEAHRPALAADCEIFPIFRAPFSGNCFPFPPGGDAFPCGRASCLRKIRARGRNNGLPPTYNCSPPSYDGINLPNNRSPPSCDGKKLPIKGSPPTVNGTPTNNISFWLNGGCAGQGGWHTRCSRLGHGQTNHCSQNKTEHKRHHARAPGGTTENTSNSSSS